MEPVDRIQIFRIKLPSAADLLCLSGPPDALVDKPELHGGRTRSFAHERGNWASYCYFKVTTGKLIEDLQIAIQKCCQDEDISVQLECIDEVHLSLTKTFVLQHHWIGEFTKTVQQGLSRVKSKERYVKKDYSLLMMFN